MENLAITLAAQNINITGNPAMRPIQGIIANLSRPVNSRQLGYASRVANR
jgi:hypothetical protein